MANLASKGGPPSERMAAALKRLVDSSKQLNAASDDLAVHVCEVDDALRALNIGIRTYVTYRHLDHPDNTYYEEFIAFKKGTRGWGIAVGTRTGPQGADWEEVEYDEWPFNEAPRELRIEAVDALPELVEKLVVAADHTTKRMIVKTAVARELADVVKALAPGKK
jgi:hypothetical protein